MFNFPFWFYPYQRPYYYNYNRPKEYKLESQNHEKKIQNETSQSGKDAQKETSILDVFGIKLYMDDLIIIIIMFLLHQEKVNDEMLYIVLILLLLS